MKVNLITLSIYTSIFLSILDNSIYTFKDYQYYYIFYLLRILLLFFIVLGLRNLRNMSIIIVIIFIFNFFWKIEGANILIPSIMLIFYLNSFYRVKIFDIYLKIISIICFLGLIEFFYTLYIGDLDQTIIKNYKFDKGAYYLKGYFTSLLYYYKNGNLLKRFMAIYDEPGYLGTFLGMTVLFLNLKFNKIRNTIIIFSGICTLSTAFYYFLFIKFLIENFNIIKKFKNIFFIFFISIVVYFFTLSNQNIYDQTIGKIKNIISTKNMNRMSKNDSKYFENFLMNGNIFLGERKKMITEDTSSIFKLVYEEGILGVVLTLYIYLILSNFKNIKSYKIRIFIIVSATSIIQRPNLLLPINMLIITCGPINYYIKDKILKKIKNR